MVGRLTTAANHYGFGSGQSEWQLVNLGSSEQTAPNQKAACRDPSRVGVKVSCLSGTVGWRSWLRAGDVLRSAFRVENLFVLKGQALGYG